MRRSARLAAVAAVVLCGSLPAAAGADDVDARLAFRIADARVVESSGLAVSRTHPGLVYTVNDSGDEARVLVVSADDGEVVGETALRGVDAFDVEALAPARGGRLVVADIGDNREAREAVELYLIDEPGPGSAAVAPREVSLTYPGGARDAEAVFAIGRRLFVVSKAFLGGAVYAAPVLGTDHDAFGLRRVADAPSTVTDATALDDGRVVLRTYSRGLVLRPPAWSSTTTFPLPSLQQGETVAGIPGRATADGRPVIYVGSEGTDSPVYALPVPTAEPPPTTQPTPSPAATPTSTAATEQPAPQPTETTERAAPQAGEQPADEGEPRARPPGYILAVAVAILVGWYVRRRRRRARNRRPPPDR